MENLTCDAHGIFTEKEILINDSQEINNFLCNQCSRDVRTNTCGWGLTPEMTIKRRSDNKEYSLTDKGFSDLCHIGGLPAQYTKSYLEEGINSFITPINDRLWKNPKDVTLILRNGKIVSILSKQYKFVSNAFLFQFCIRNLSKYRLLGMRWTPEKMRIIFINEDGDIMDETNIAHQIINSETGDASLNCQWALFRSACTNLTLFGKEILESERKIHRGNNFAFDKMMFLANESSVRNKLSGMMNIARGKNIEGKALDNYKARINKIMSVSQAQDFLSNIKENVYNEWLRITQEAQKYPLNLSEKMENIGGWLLAQAA